MRRWACPGLRARALLATVLVAPLAAVLVPPPAGAETERALPAVCSTSATDPDVWTWVHDAATAASWQDPANWRHTVGGVPTPGVPPGDATAIVCLHTSDTVVADGLGTAYRLNQLHADAPTTSSCGPDGDRRSRRRTRLCHDGRRVAPRYIPAARSGPRARP